jgi:4'-phosphopantetheinyl transferase
VKIFCKDIPAINWEKPGSPLIKQSYHVWALNVIDNVEKLKKLQAHLNTDELKRAQRYVFEKDRQQYITAHGSLRSILSNYLNTSPEQIQFRKTNNRKPFISYPLTSLKFNISHAGDKILIGISQEDIGVDIEIIKDDFEFKQLASTYFSTKEQDEIKRSLKPAETFYKFWTRKEAILKASGVGITDELKNISVCSEENISLFKNDFFVASFNHENFVGSIASPKKLNTLQFFRC